MKRKGFQVLIKKRAMTSSSVSDHHNNDYFSEPRRFLMPPSAWETKSCHLVLPRSEKVITFISFTITRSLLGTCLMFVYGVKLHNGAASNLGSGSESLQLWRTDGLDRTRKLCFVVKNA